MPIDITIPTAGESITDVRMGTWHRADGDWVQKDDVVVEIETDKTTLEVPAPESGVLKVLAHEGEDRRVGDVIGTIDPGGAKPDQAAAAAPEQRAGTAETAPPSAKVPSPAARPTKPGEVQSAEESRATPTARKLAADKGVSLAGIQGTGPSGRITKSDVLGAARSTPASAPPREEPTALAKSRGVFPAAPRPSAGPTPLVMVSGTTTGMTRVRTSRRERMTKIRERIAQRLVEAQHNAAMLTTFNEADMTEVLAFRSEHREEFEKRHGVGLGFMPFFVKACAAALQQFPRVNASIVPASGASGTSGTSGTSGGGSEIEYHDFIDIAIAVGTEKGLVVPVLRNVEAMSFADIEMTIRDLAARAREGKLAVEEMTGGTFTITNGGVYGSLNSTPILNPPQSGILGMHKIMKRAIEHPPDSGQIALRPMMYLALSYDHRIVDGAEAVRFLVHIKQAIEHPERLLLGL